MIFLGFLIVAILFVLSVAISDTPLYVFGDPASFLFVLSGLTGYILLFGRNEFVRGIKTFFAFSFSPDEEAGHFFQQLATFTVRWGLLGMFLGLALVLIDLDPNRMGTGIAICLLSALYTLGLAGFVFLPIGLRLSPSETHPASWKWSFSTAVNLSLTGLALFVLLAGIRILADINSFSAIFSGGHIDLFRILSPAVIFVFWDLPSFVLVVGSWWAFRLASGKRRQGIAPPAMILIGIFWSIQCFVFMLSDFKPEHSAMDSVVALLPTLYAFIAAAGFLIGDMRRCFKNPPPAPPAEGAEQAKEIIDRVVEDVQKRKR